MAVITVVHRHAVDEEQHFVVVARLHAPHPDRLMPRPVFDDLDARDLAQDVAERREA